MAKRPARTPQERENQLVNAAYDFAEEQFEKGTASSQITSHFLKMGSSREFLEQERMRHEIELMDVRMETLAAEKRIEGLFADAIAVMTGRYRGLPQPREDDEE